MTQLEATFQHNPFDNIHFQRRRKVVFLLDQVDRFTALDAAGFADRITKSRAVAQQVSEALANTGSALNQQMGATQGSDAAFDQVKRVASRQFAILQATQGKGSEGVVKIFGRHISDYTDGLTHGNATTRLPALLKNLAANPGIAGADLTKALTDAIKDYTDSRTDQGSGAAAVDAHRTTTAGLDPTLNQVLWLNQAAVVQQYPAADQAPQRLAAADYSLLNRPAPGHHSTTFADYLPAGRTADLDDDDPQPLPAPTTRLTLRNPGPVRLQVALSASATAFPTAGVMMEVTPGATLKLTLADLGDAVALPFLLVHNPTSELGQYQVVLG